MTQPTRFSPLISSIAKTTTAVALGLLLASCAEFSFKQSKAPSAPEYKAQSSAFGDEWDDSITRMGTAPIIPPSEDIRVGDIFVYPFNPDFPFDTGEHYQRIGGLAISPRWATLDLLSELDEEYRLRPDWPGTPDGYLDIDPDPKNRKWPEAGETGNESIYAGTSKASRLRLTGVPEFSTISLSEGDINRLVPTEAINLVLGSAWNDDKVITIRMSSAETYSLSLQKIIGAALENSDLDYALRSPYRDHLALVAKPESDSVWVRILSDVLYVRSMDIIIQSQAAFEPDEETGADEFVEADEVPVVAVEETVEGESGSSEGGEEGNTEEEVMLVAEVEEIPDHALDPAFAAFVRAKAINEILVESGSDVLPGGFMRFVSVTDDSAIIRRVWQRGLAIGARGLTLELNKIDGEVLRSSNLGTMPIVPPKPETVEEPESE